jgi:nitroreductase
MMADYTRADMELGDAIHGQRAIRRFADRPIEPDTLDRILDAARRAPSSMNEQRWAFVVVTDRDRLRELAAIGDYADHVARAAAAVALVTPETDDASERESIAFDLGQCAQNLMLRAWDLGVGSVHAAVYDEGLAQRLLGYPDGLRCDYVLSLGYPAEPPVAQGVRKPFDEVVHRDRW